MLDFPFPFLDGVARLTASWSSCSRFLVVLLAGAALCSSPCVLWRLAPQCVRDGLALRSLVVGARSGVRGQFALRDLTWFKPLCVSSVGRAESRCGAVHTSDEVMRFSSPLGGFRWRRSTTEFAYNSFEQGIRSFVRLSPLRCLTVV